MDTVSISFHYASWIDYATCCNLNWVLIFGQKVKSPFFGQFSWRECTNLLKIWIECAPNSHFEKKNAHIVMTLIQYTYTYGELQQQQMHNTTSFAKIRIYFTTVPSSINYQVPFYLELLCNFFAKEFNPIITSAIRFII